jgi:hypothetical protein
MPSERVLLIGNGINRLNRGNYSWESLLRELIVSSNLENIVHVGKQKPFPLLFEEILNHMEGESFDSNLKKLKTEVKVQIEKALSSNDYHLKVMQLEYSNILTTNYDYLFEKSLDMNFIKQRKPGKGNQYLYSDKRVNKIDNKFIWHIHGELDNGFNDNRRYSTQSIMLGFDHYTSYLNNIYQFLVNNNQSINNQVIKQELDRSNTFDKRWYYYLFTHNVDIVGLDLTSSEVHLWWLFNYRSKLSKRKGNIKNTITYHIPSYETLIKKDDIDLLKSFDIKINPIHSEFNGGKFYEGFYDNFLKLNYNNE